MKRRRNTRASAVVAMMLAALFTTCESGLLAEIREASRTVDTTPTAAPVASFTMSPADDEGNASGTAPFQVTFTDTSTGEITSREWDFEYQPGNPVVDSTAENPTHTYSPGSFSVRLKVSGPGGHHEIIQNNCIRSYGSIVAGFQLASGSDADGLERHVTFENLSEDLSHDVIESWAWNFGNGETSALKNPGPVYYASAGTYTVSLTASGPAGTHTETKTGFIIVGSLPEMPSDFQATGVGTRTIDLSWSHNQQNITGFRIYRNGQYIQTVFSGTTWTNTGLSEETSYYYEIEGYNQYGSLARISVTGSTLPRWTVVTVPEPAAGVESLFTHQGFALDSNDRPHFLRVRMDTSALYHSLLSGSSWSHSTVANYNDALGGIRSAIAIDESDSVHVAIIDLNGNALRYRKRTGTTWGAVQTVETLDYHSSYLPRVSLAIDGDNYPHLSYHDSQNRSLRYAALRSNGWQIYTTRTPSWDDERVGYISTIAARGDDRWVVFDSRRSTTPITLSVNVNRKTLYNYYIGSFSVLENVGPPSHISLAHVMPLAMDSLGRPHTVYRDFATGGMRHARRPTSTWLYLEVVSGYSGTVIPTSLAIGSDDVPQLVYVNTDLGDYFYARFEGNSWVTESISATIVGSGAGWVQIAVDSNNLPHLYVFDMDSITHRWARRNPE